MTKTTNDTTEYLVPKVGGHDYDNDADHWGAGEPAFEPCPGNDRPLKEGQHFYTNKKNNNDKCSYCDYPFKIGVGRLNPEYEVREWEKPVRDADGNALFPLPHMRRMSVVEQAETKIKEIAESLGFDPYGKVALYARVTAESAHKATLAGVDEMVALGLAYLSKELTKRSAASEATRQFNDLLNWRPEYFHAEEFPHQNMYSEGDEDCPFFTERFLYPLLGKDSARSLLRYINAVGAALAVSERRDEDGDD